MEVSIRRLRIEDRNLPSTFYFLPLFSIFNHQSSCHFLLGSALSAIMRGMAKHPQLTVEKRTVLGKKVKQLRRAGTLPGNVYGKGLPSVAIQMKTAEFQDLYKQVGETGLIDVVVDGARHPSLVKNLQMEYPLRIPLHVDFYEVNLKEKVKTMVPLSFVGEPAAVTEKIGILLQPLSEVEVEALPEELPEMIEVNVEKLAAIDDHILVSDLKVADGIEILSEATQTVAKIAEPVQAEPEPEPEPEVAEGEAGAEGAEAGTPPEGGAAEGESTETPKEE
jgi:large subunit ribosomal protein L25